MYMSTTFVDDHYPVWTPSWATISAGYWDFIVCLHLVRVLQGPKCLWGKPWQRLWDQIRSMNSLRELTVDLEAGYDMMDDSSHRGSIQKAILKPLFAICGLDRFEVVVNWNGPGSLGSTTADAPFKLLERGHSVTERR